MKSSYFEIEFFVVLVTDVLVFGFSGAPYAADQNIVTTLNIDIVEGEEW